MKIIFIRHGQAAPYCKDDAGRDLTEFGQEQAKQTADYLLAHHQIDLIISSPYNRAEQTAKILQNLAMAQGQMPDFMHLDSITPDDNPKMGLEGVDKLINERFGDAADEQTIAVVCHMPIVSRMTSILTGDSPVAFELAACQVLEMPVVAPAFAAIVDNFAPEQP